MTKHQASRPQRTAKRVDLHRQLRLTVIALTLPLIALSFSHARGEVFSVDDASFLTVVRSPGDILQPSNSDLLDPPVLLTDTMIGATGADVNAISNGNDGPLVPGLTLFSVDRNSQGVPLTGVALERIGAAGGPDDHAADIYTWFSTGINIQTRDGDGVPNPAPGVPPFLGLLEGNGDDVDAYDHDLQGHPVFFSYAAGHLGSELISASAADIFYSFNPQAVSLQFASWSDLGLHIDDDLDALALNDADNNGFYGTGDSIFYSLAPGSPTLTLLGASPADILTTPAPFQPPQVVLTAAQLGLLPTDNLNALSTVLIPEPSSASLALLAALALAGLSGRRRNACDRR